VKYILKLILSQIIELLHKWRFIKQINTKLNYKIYRTGYKHTFFGYYDKSPFNDENSKLLAITTNHDDIISKPEEAIIGYFDLEKNSNFLEIDKTTTWCWQQGCRLMWFGKDSVIYNKVVNDNYGSVVYDIKNKKQIKQFDFAIYDKTSDNKWALSLNFSRLQYFRPGYGYCNFLKEEEKTQVLKSDGIYLCSLENNSKELIISLPQIIAIKNDDRMIESEHYINHLKFSPDDKTFLFYHIWNRGNRRYTRAILANIEGEIIRVIDNKTFMSHYTFKNTNELLIFTKTKKNGYHLYNLERDSYYIINSKLQEDGHQTFINDEEILSDSSPNKFTRNQKIIIFDKSDLKILAKLYSPIKYVGEYRCDLHPRVSSDKQLISIDIPTFSGRKLMVLEL